MKYKVIRFDLTLKSDSDIETIINSFYSDGWVPHFTEVYSVGVVPKLMIIMEKNDV